MKEHDATISESTVQLNTDATPIPKASVRAPSPNRKFRRQLGQRGQLTSVLANHYAEQRLAISDSKTLRNRAKRARKQIIIWV